MNYLITFVRKIMPKELPKPVGRWRIENCNKQMNRKIDLSNDLAENICWRKHNLQIIKIEMKYLSSIQLQNTRIK
jgi:hypothetical protein